MGVLRFSESLDFFQQNHQPYYFRDMDGYVIRDTDLMLKIDLCIFFTLPGVSGLQNHPFSPLDYQNRIKNAGFTLI